MLITKKLINKYKNYSIFSIDNECNINITKYNKKWKKIDEYKATDKNLTLAILLNFLEITDNSILITTTESKNKLLELNKQHKIPILKIPIVELDNISALLFSSENGHTLADICHRANITYIGKDINNAIYKSFTDYLWPKILNSKNLF